MESRRDALRSVAGALAGAVAVVMEGPPAEAAAVKCYGIAAAGQNDCANTAGTHACAGQSQNSYDGADWKAMPDAAACTAEGGRLEPFEGKNPAKA